MPNIENPILSGGHPQIDSHEMGYVSECISSKCNEEIYRGEGFRVDGFLACSLHCVGQYQLDIEEIEDMSVRY